MKPKRIILVRHGESEGNEKGSTYETVPDYALNLTDTGREQALKAGQEIDKIVGSESIHAYVSPFYRTRQTFEQIASVVGDRIIRKVEEPRVREQEWGNLRSSEREKEIMGQRGDYGIFYFRIEDGESGADVYDRISTFVETSYRDYRKPDYPQNALIVTHGVALRIFLMNILHWSVEEFQNTLNPANCQVVVLEQNDKGEYVLATTMKKKMQ